MELLTEDIVTKCQQVSVIEKLIDCDNYNTILGLKLLQVQELNHVTAFQTYCLQ
jgi:hypothetical protein